MKQSEPVQSPLTEERHRRELEALQHADTRPRPAGWRLSPRAVASFVLGLDAPVPHPDGEPVVVARKIYGNDALVERAIVTLTSARGLLLVGGRLIVLASAHRRAPQEDADDDEQQYLKRQVGQRDRVEILDEFADLHDDITSGK